jgi:ATP-dependent DNA helicase RecG
VYGKAKMYGNTWNIPHPELTEWQNVGQKTGIQPVYSSTEKLSAKGLHTKGIEKLTAVLALQLTGKITEILPDELLKAHNFMSREAAFKEVHLPTSEHAFHVARQRLKFEELFFLQMELLLRKQISVSKSKGFIFSEVGSLFTDFYEKYLPFSLTGAQKRVLKEIRKDFLSGHHMNRLLQGDVGSGKTLVALLTMLIANGNGLSSIDGSYRNFSQSTCRNLARNGERFAHSN